MKTGICHLHGRVMMHEGLCKECRKMPTTEKEESWEEFKNWIQPFVNGDPKSDIEKNSIEMITSKVQRLLFHQQEELIKEIEALPDVIVTAIRSKSGDVDLNLGAKYTKDIIQVIKE